jgi:hypothetical protein
VLSSLIAFLVQSTQMIVGMVVAFLYLAAILLRQVTLPYDFVLRKFAFVVSSRIQPYLRKTDDRIYLLAQLEIFLVLQCGWILFTEGSLDPVLDFVLSLALVLMTLAVLVLFVFTAVQNARAKLRAIQRDQALLRAKSTSLSKLPNRRSVVNIDTTGLEEDKSTTSGEQHSIVGDKTVEFAEMPAGNATASSTGESP